MKIMNHSEIMETYYRSLIGDNAAGSEFNYALENAEPRIIKRAFDYLLKNPVGNKARYLKVARKYNKLLKQGKLS